MSLQEGEDEDEDEGVVPPELTRTQERVQFSEYSHLLRTIRTRVNSDVTLHLTSAAATERKSRRRSVMSEDPRVGSDEFERSSTRGDEEAAPSPKAKINTALTRTRWPLMPSDVQTPAYSFSDEVRYMAEIHLAQQLRLNSARDTSNATADEVPDGNSSQSQDLIEEHPALSEPVISGLTLRSASLLDHMLDMLGSNREETKPSLTVRLNPMGWETVIHLLAASGAVDETVLARSAARLEAIYGGSAHLALYRYRHQQAFNEPRVFDDTLESVILDDGGFLRNAISRS